MNLTESQLRQIIREQLYGDQKKHLDKVRGALQKAAALLGKRGGYFQGDEDGVREAIELITKAASELVKAGK